jgi:hypothetical protein
MRNEIRLASTALALNQVWRIAEDRVRHSVVSKHHGPNEEAISFLLQGELAEALNDASERGVFGRAFLADLQRAIPDLRQHLPSLRFAERVVGTVHFHSRHHEGRASASDVVVVVKRPVALLESGTNRRLRIRQNYERALFVQAKLGRPIANGRTDWGDLTRSQRIRFPKMVSYLSLLLYRWSDPDGSAIESFKWQLCAGLTLAQIKASLKNDVFPDQQDSDSILDGLMLGALGTDDADIIKRSARDPRSRRWNVLEIRLSWPQDDAPPSSVALPLLHVKPTLLLRNR